MIEGFEKACKKALEILPGILSAIMLKTKLLKTPSANESQDLLFKGGWGALCAELNTSG